jgi:uncharacterized protein (TIGR02996 family)
MDLERAFLRDIIASPDDPAARLVYADWLEENGGPEGAVKGEFLRLEVALAVAPDAPGRGETEARLRELRAGLDPGWVAALARAPIENCEVRFRFQCPQRWEALTPTDEAGVRFCESCRRSVHYCNTLQEARGHAWSGHCVVVDLGVQRAPGDLGPILTGWWDS